MIVLGLLIANAAFMILLVMGSGKKRDWETDDREQMEWLRNYKKD